MRIRKNFYACYDKSEETFIKNCLTWIKKPLVYKIIIKYTRNCKISIIRFLSINCKKNDWQYKRTLPISLDKKDLIESIANLYKEETGINIYFNNDLKKNINSTEQNKIINEQKNLLKKQYEYLLILLNNLKSENLC